MADQPEPDLRIGVMGPLRVEVSGRSVAVGSRLQRGLLAFLTLHAGQVVSSSRLIEALWGENAPETVTSALQVHVSGLRRALGDAAHHLITRPGGYLLAIRSDHIDARMLESAAAAGPSSDAFSAAAGLPWSHEILADLAGVPFVSGVVGALEETRWRFLELRVEADLAGGRHAEIAGEIESMLLVQPYREPLWRALMVALYRCGRQADALNAYRRAAQLLADDLGLDPGPELVATHRAVLAGDLAMPDVPHQRYPAELADGDAAVAILLTDLAGVTQLWQQHAAVMPTLLLAHHQLFAEVVIACGGWVPAGQPDGAARMAVFSGPSAADTALRAALRIGDAVAGRPWPRGLVLKVRQAVDQGRVAVRQGQVFGAIVARCALIREAAHPGQVLVRSAAGEQANDLIWTDLGEHTVPEIGDRVHLWQASGPDEHPSFPPVLLSPTTRTPPVPDGFFGRSDFVALLASAVRPGVLVTVTAPGGTGKTSVAVALAHRPGEKYVGRVAFVDLVSVQHREDVGTAVALALGVLESGMPPWTAIANATAGRHTLIVLDNCEQITGLAQVLAEQLRAAGDVAWLATSRVPIGVVGERVITLTPLDVPPADVGDEAGLRDSAGGRLLLDRARQASPGLRVDGPEARDLAAVVRRLDGHPLALELAAARLRFQSVAAVRRGLDETLENLRDVTGRADPRQRDLTALLSWSIDRQSPSALRLLDALATFETAAPIAALTDVSGLAEPDAFEPLASLLDGGLARAVPSQGEPRFDILVPVREHVRHRWTAQARDVLLDGHARYHRRWAEHGSVELHNTSRDDLWIADSLQCRTDALAALDRLRSRDPSSALRLACDLFVLWADHDDEARGREILTALAAQAPDTDEPYLSLARVLIIELAGSRATERDVQAAWTIADTSDVPELQAAALLELAFQDLVNGRHESAPLLLDRARARADVADRAEGPTGRTLNGGIRPEVTRNSADSVQSRLARWRDPLGFLRFTRERLAACGGPDHFAFAMWLGEVFRAEVDTGRLAEAHVTAARIPTIPITVGARGTRVFDVPAALLAARDGRAQDALQIVRRYRSTQSFVHGEVLETAAIAADVLLELGDPEAAMAELECVNEVPASGYRSIASARRARALVELARAEEASAVLDEVARELVAGEASPGALTYLLTRAMLTTGAERARFLADHDHLLSSTGTVPWPRDQADRARFFS